MYTLGTIRMTADTARKEKPKLGKEVNIDSKGYRKISIEQCYLPRV